jgi:hypothetical protein
MTKTEFRDLLHSLADAWSRRDYAAAAGFFAEDVRYGDPTRYSFNTIVFDEEQQIGAAEYTYEGTHLYHGLVLAKVAGGEIHRWREYQHVDPREWEEFTSAMAF